MQHFPIETLSIEHFFPQLKEIPNYPETLNIRGSLERIVDTTLIAIVGSRKCTPYGKQACEQLIKGLAGYPVTIVSGLAYGIDAIAHQAAIDSNIPTIAFPGSGLDWDVLYPKQNKTLAEKILRAGGVLLSEFENDHTVAPWNFPMRNRLEAGIASLIIVIEAAEQSGTLITARLGTEYNKVVGAVPGPITSETSRGANWLLKLGAVPITCSEDILRELNIDIPGELPFHPY
jgi:DNA processing protein